MDSTLIIGIIIVLAIVSPIWWLIRSQSAGKRKLENEVAAQGNGFSLNITEHESWGSKVIGIDREGEKAAFAVFGNPSNQLYVADLKQFSRCYAEKKLLDTKVKGATDTFTDILIHFVPRDKGARDVIFPIYSDAVDTSLGNELHISEEWIDKINGIIHRNSR